ncbi:MAG: cell envelope-related transcriptional attenuator [Frankiales bacterium]|nr:cell envelope-related transcriptional attenuator [Frankiales bacterium]
MGRILSWIALSTAVVVFLGAGGLWVAFNHYTGQISRINLPGIAGHTAPKGAPRNAQNFLLVGSDTRAGANGVGTQGVGGSFVSGQRSDTVILMHLYGNSDKAELLSFPRDSYVEIPAYTNPTTGHVTPAHHDKLNSAFSLGGPALLIATIENLSNIRIDHFVQIDFAGFKGMVNKLGGVDICLTTAAQDHYTGINLSAGPHHISGDTALAFVRQRYGLANGDLDRIARQQQFIGSLVHKVLSAGTLLNPLKLNGFLDVATSSVQADKNLSGNDIKNLALRLSKFSSGGVLFSTLPISDIAGVRNGASVVLLDPTKDEQLFAALRSDQAPGAPASTGTKPATTPLIVSPGNVRVAVFNGSGVTGVGRKAAADIAPLGFQVIGIPTNRGSGATQTTIYYGASKADSARTLQAAIPGSLIQADNSLGSTLDLVVGSTYKGAQKVTVSTTTTTPSGTTTTATAPIKTAQNNPCTR